ncbi:DEAD/DEAH box helicase family protein [Aureibaculum sp. A20]|uniref:DEAD/DEAH box helicase family protein n=1 Tax=Aureibaculum flavum TaxID=2795986 RepID=A0ABS0WRW1_9FLAO|nr:DEAD/DEAH box helicase family protein [Aureibaculum flavum]MBJ2174715.1 DEAD/DEAH box helicase family protein [Aureibaculum flavum]
MKKRKSILQPKEVESHLRDYQLEGVDLMSKYISDYDNDKTILSGLVALPTGSGKTIIIASLACCLPRKGCILVLSPRRPVIDQLHKELSGNLFLNKFNGLSVQPTKSVYDEKATEINIKSDSVICWTIQKLHKVRDTNPKLYEILKQNVKLILFDEGHYEPAPKWSDTIRAFRAPKIIFTATPFRNDFKKFDIDWDNYVYRKSYEELKDLKYLRKVKVEDFGKKDNIVIAVNDAILRFDKIKKTHKEARLIIKCDSSESIISISKELVKLKRNFFSIHETFKKDFKDKNEELKPYLLNAVPKDQEDEVEDIWVHQFKLVEGIDSSKFRCLAIIDEMTNTRSLVQQIGRIIRNPKKNDDTAYVYNYTEADYINAWNGFVSLDKSGKITKTLAEQILDDVNKNVGEHQYIDKKVRLKLTKEQFVNWTEEELKSQVQIPLKANFIEKRKSFSSTNFINNYLDHNLKDKDHVFYKNIYGTNSGLYLYFTVKNSPYLTNSFFPEITHQICFFKEEKDFLIFYDSGKLLPLGKDKLGVGYGLDSSRLRSIFKQTNDTVLSRVALKSSNIGSLEPHSHSFMASSIKDTAPNLNDFSHFLSSTFGHYLDKKVYKDYKDTSLKDKEFQIRTYIGFSTGRISQSEGKNVKFKEYLDWIDYLCNSLKNRSRIPAIFNRYSTEVSNVKDPFPECILLDLFELENVKIVNEIEGSDEDVIIEELSIPEKFSVINKSSDGVYSFEVIINENNFVIKIEFDNKRNKYILVCEEIAGTIETVDAELGLKVVNLIKVLNRKQCFRVLTKKGLSYSGGRFYEPHFKFGKKFDDKVSPIPNMLISIDALSKRYSEKGTVNGTSADSWQDDSIFSLLANRGEGSQLKGYMLESGEKEELLICTDLNTEPADFILVTDKKIVFIHVKGKGNKPDPSHGQYGASAISEICNQAVKNAHLLSIFDKSPPGNLKTWTTPWNPNKKKAYNVQNRIKTSSIPTGIDSTSHESIWEYMVRKKMDVNISKEVWLVMGYTMKRDVFLEKIGSSNPPAEAKQAALTLESTLANIHSLGLKLKVFCS